MVLQMTNSGGMHTKLVSMLKAGYNPQIEPFVLGLLQAFRTCQLLDLRTKSRIFVPKGRLLMGCLDETKTLNYGEVFVQVTPTPGDRRFVDDGLTQFPKYPLGEAKKKGVAHFVTGWVVVAKNPCVHPGDIRKLKAVDVPGLHHMFDCLVFPQKGHR
jgi:RNA-dependent RNA polymerase